MTIITTTHKLDKQIIMALVMASDMKGVFGGSDPDNKEALVFIILDIDTLIITRVLPDGETVFKSDACKNMFDTVTEKCGIKLGTE